MPLEQAFLAAIQSNPDDDAPRLIYADWLEERGDPRAAFLRAECLLAGLSPQNEQYAELKARLRALGSRVDVDWVAQVSRAPVWLEPECLRFVSEGWIQMAIHWHDERLVHFPGGGPDQGGPLPERSPTAGEWTSFWSVVDELHAWDWAGNYGRHITCGVPWVLRLKYRGRALECGGNGFLGDAAPPGFGRFYQAMCRLIKVNDYLPEDGSA